MKHQLQLLLCCLLLSIGAISQNIPAYVPTNGLVGYWPFNGNANDESGNGNHGTVNGATLTSDRNGYNNSAFYFNYHDEITTTFNLIQGTQTRTFSFWMKNQNGNRTITPIWYGGYSNQPVQGAAFNIVFNRNEQHDQCGCWPTTYQGIGVTTDWIYILKSTTVGDNLWHNWVVVQENIGDNFTQIKYFKDGVFINSNTIFDYNSNSSTVINTVNQNKLKFGKSQANSSYPSSYLDRAPTESLDDIAIYNRALTQQEITALYTGVPPCTPTSSTTNLTIPSTSLPYTWNGLTFNNSGSQTATLTNSKGCDSTATLNLTINYILPNYIPTNGLVGYWPFNGNANDESGNGNHGTVNGATLTTDRNGVAGKAYSFDGVNDNINTGINSSISLNSNAIITISLWANIDSNNTGTFITKYENFNPNQSSIYFLETSGIVEFGSNGTSAFPKCSTQSQSWSNFVVVCNGSNASIFLNGNFKCNLNYPTNSNISNLPLIFGSTLCSANSTICNWFKGKLDDIAIYNRALTQQEITALYTGVPPCTPTSSTTNLSIPSTSLPYTWNGLTFNNSGSQTATLTNSKGCDSLATLNLTVNYTLPNYLPTNGLVGYWPFNGNANDESGNGNHGTVNGMTLTVDRNGALSHAGLFNNLPDIMCTNNLISNPTDFTLSIWFKSLNSGRIFGFDDGQCTHLFSQDRYIDLMPNGQLRFHINHISGNFFLYSNPGKNDNKWHHVICNFGQDGMKIYIDGNLEALNNNNLVRQYNGYWRAGGLNDNSNGSILGSIDDIAIYNRALTQQEITALYTGTVPSTISANSGVNGTISPSGSTNINSGASQTYTYTFTPNTGFKVDSVIVNGFKIDSTTSYTFANVTTNQSIRVTFTPIIYTINTQSNSNGTTNPSGSINVNYGSNQRITIIPNAGFYVDSVLVDGIPVDSITGYTFLNVTANHTLRVVFKMKYNNQNYTTNSTSTTNSSNQLIAYQAYARNNAGASLNNQSIQVKFSLLTDSINGSVIYAESHSLSTNSMGLFTAEIGNGTPIQGTWQGVNWSASKKYLKTEIDMGTGFVNMGTQQLLAVPYAIHSNTSNNASNAKSAEKTQTIENNNLPVFNTNAAAINAGLLPGQLYRTTTGDLKVVY